ncbi:arsenate reductase [Taibaiella sp. KBW10]|uniref:arsenate reductase family protein n=1 Tax=Taibaiella sp. KBW10 TaxID=2153357 RepID=UPI000F5B6E48|nr:ArsC/Spx/MgsR family protein [Taibaiella sp. KBW10]RQO30913.1 arsenate reductase [Taibaiella sp. KBW10]
MITLLHINTCSKSRCALDFVQTSHQEFEIRDYIADPLNKAELQDLLEKLKAKPLDIIRKGALLFKEQYEGKVLSDAEWIEVLVEHPALLERPILIDGEVALVGRPPERIAAYLQTKG